MHKQTDTDWTECGNTAALPRLPAVTARIAARLPRPPLEWLANIVLRHVFAAALADGELDFLAGRELVLHIEDAGLELAFRLADGHLRCGRPLSRDTSIRGSSAAFLLLAAKRMDADALFFQRALVMSGDTELGLRAKYLLDAMPLEALPRPLPSLLPWLAAQLPDMPATPCQ